MTLNLTRLAALSGFIAVTLGAFGAHALKDSFSAEAIGWWNTATLYLLTHTIAALVIGLSNRGGLICKGGYALIFGALLFAATLYAMAVGAPRWFGAITPLGGVDANGVDAYRRWRVSLIYSAGNCRRLGCSQPFPVNSLKIRLNGFIVMMRKTAGAK